jgi:hypothetical protein
MKKSLLRLSKQACRLFIACCPMALFISCGNDSSKTINIQGDTLVVKDTVVKTVHDTLAPKDTLLDTLRIAVGKTQVIAVAYLVGDMQKDTVFVSDSFYAAASLFSNPQVNNAVVTFNGHLLGHTPDQRKTAFFMGIQHTFDLFPTLSGSVYETHFKDISTLFRASIIIPSFSSDTTKKISYDTLVDSVAYPPKAYPLRFSHDNGVAYDSVEYNLGQFPSDYYPYRIHLDRGLKITCHGGAAWYAVDCQKYLETEYEYQPVGQPLDTFSADSSITIPASFISQDTVFRADTSYDFLYIQVIPVNGPVPASWGTFGSFKGNGYIFCMRLDNPYMAINASPFADLKAGLLKRASGVALPKPALPVDVVGRILSGRLIR